MKDQLQHLRKCRNLTQEEFAEIIGVKLTTYQKYERDVISPTYETLCKIADFYGVSTDYLLGRDADKPNPVNGLDDDSAAVVNAFCDLSADKRKIVIDFMRDAISKAENKPKISKSQTCGQAEKDKEAENQAKKGAS